MVSWNMCGYMNEKLEHLLLTAVAPAYKLVLAYLLQVTHQPSGTTLLGNPAGYPVV